MKSKIEFIAETKEMLEILEKPYPAIQTTPSWFNEMPTYTTGKKDVDNFGDPLETVKKCMPFFDAMTAGYYIPLYTDVWVENQGIDKINIKWAWNTIEVVAAHDPRQFEKYPLPAGFLPMGFKWINPWIVKTPPGWSTLFIQPTHYDELPFHCLTGIVDTDKHPTPVNFIFVLKSSFSGLIQKGTPLIQAIPFKRQDFISEFSYDRGGKLATVWKKAKTVYFDRYKKYFRSPKKYEQGQIKKCPFNFSSKE